MSDAWAGVTAGMLAGAAGATAQNAIAYLSQSVAGESSVSSPTSGGPAAVAAQVTGADAARAAGLGPLGGLAVGIGVGAAAGLLRGLNITPPGPVAAVATSAVALLAGNGVAAATGVGQADWTSPAKLVPNLAAHFAYGVVTSVALHRMLDPRTSITHR